MILIILYKNTWILSSIFKSNLQFRTYWKYVPNKLLWMRWQGISYSKVAHPIRMHPPNLGLSMSILSFFSKLCRWWYEIEPWMILIDWLIDWLIDFSWLDAHNNPVKQGRIINADYMSTLLLNVSFNII